MEPQRGCDTRGDRARGGVFFFFFFNPPATTEIYTLSLHDALPIWLAKYSKVLGNGLTVLDFGMRVKNIEASYQKGRNWEREMFVQSSSFATTAIAGNIALDTGMFLLMATPVGWFGLIVGGIAVAGDRKSTRLNSSHIPLSRMPSSSCKKKKKKPYQASS